MRPPEKMIIYNLFPLLAGKFSEWERHMSRAAEMGFNWIYVNPVQSLGASGSLYSVSDYFSLNAALVDELSGKTAEQQLRETLARAHELGLSVMIDLVINHCAADSILLQRHPEWFLWERPGKVVHPSAKQDGEKVIWYDLAKFDHLGTKDANGLFRFFGEVVEHLLGQGFDGFRCDAAYQVPTNFWRRLIRDAKAKRPGVQFFAETLGCTPEQTVRTAQAGFDYVFNSSKWWDYKSHWLMEQYHLTREVTRSIGFPESHDTMRLYEELHGNVEGVKQRYLFTALFSAGVMIPIGFEFCFKNRLDVVRTRPMDWEETSVDISSFIRRVNRIKGRYAIFQEEAASQILNCDNPNILVMWKASLSKQEESLLILNKDIWNKQYFHVETLQNFFQAGPLLVDVSPEFALDYLPAPFSYDLRPGQGIVLMASREH